MNREFLISYAQDFVSFLIRSVRRDLLDKIRLIILFGSVVRGEATRKSDIDIFIDVTSGEDLLEKALDSVVEEFYTDAEERWKPFKIRNVISLKLGKLSEWKDLHPSVITDGLILYGKYKPECVEGKHNVIFSWENMRLSDSKRVSLNRELYGYNRRGKRYSGLLDRYGGEKLSTGSLLILLEYLRTFEEVFRKYHIAVRITQVLSY